MKNVLLQTKCRVFSSAVILALSAFISMGCQKSSDAPEVTPPKKDVKPLPEECESGVEVQISWPADWRAAGYFFQLVRAEPPGDVFEERRFSGVVSDQAFTVPRGVRLLVNAHKSFKNGQSEYSTQEIFAPICSEREKWRDNFQSYEEPIAIKLDWQ